MRILLLPFVAAGGFLIAALVLIGLFRLIGAM